MFIKHDTLVAKYIAGAGLVDEPGWVVTGVSDEDAFPGFVIKFVPVVGVNVNVARAAEDKELGQC